VDGLASRTRMTDMSAILEQRRSRSEEIELHHSLLRFVEGRLRDRGEGEDIVQETYVRLYDYRRTRSVADVGAFCFAVARNLLKDRLRRLQRAPERAELSEGLACALPRPDEILSYRQRVEILTRALASMPPLRREVFLRRRLDDQPSATIAADLDLSLSAVEKHVVRAMADLRGALARRGLSLSDGA
jgi:RNA polymerase sigma factor (sigma-70 family)